jgi:hypothetical protein
MICVLGGRYSLSVAGMTSGWSTDVRAISGADVKRRRVSLSTAWTEV